MRGREIDIQEIIIEKLSEYNISPFSVICTFQTEHNGLVAITFFINSDLKEVLNLLDYDNQCDKTGFLVIDQTNTLILYDLALINFYTNI